MTLKNKIIISLLSLIVILPVLALSCAVISMNVLPVSKKKTDTIVKGMGKEKVKAILGNPSNIRNGDSEKHSKCWTYSKPLFWNFYVVWFEEGDNGVVYEAYWGD